MSRISGRLALLVSIVVGCTTSEPNQREVRSSAPFLGARWASLSSVHPSVLDALEAGSETGEAINGLNAVDIDAPFRPDRLTPKEVRGLIRGQDTTYELHYKECESTLEWARSEPWACADKEQEPGECMEERIVETGASALDAFQEEGWLSEAETIYLICSESCRASRSCPNGRFVQGDLAELRCRRLVAEMEERGGATILGRVRAMALYCNDPDRQVAALNEDFQRATIWFRFPNRHRSDSATKPSLD